MLKYSICFRFEKRNDLAGGRACRSLFRYARFNNNVVSVSSITLLVAELVEAYINYSNSYSNLTVIRADFCLL